MKHLTAFQRDLLYVIARLDAPSGLEVKDELEVYYGENVRHGRLYPNLDALVEKDYVKKGKRNERTNEYRLRGHARDAIELRASWQAECYDALAETDDGAADGEVGA